MYPLFQGGHPTAREDDDCKRHGGRGLGKDGKVNESEPLLNVVRSSKPKTLIGLSQKACGRVAEFFYLATQTKRPPAERRDLTHLLG
jgi:hypothetical protein